MTPNIKIVFAGIGGVGGYFGGLMARKYEPYPNVGICFFARGGHLDAIKEHGLKVTKGDETFTARPRIASDNAADFGVANLVILCIKSYDLDTVIAQLDPCIDDTTVILPLLNGVDNRERIAHILPDNLILDGCAHIVSRITGPGEVENKGNIQKIMFGSEGVPMEELRYIETLMLDAGIEASLEQAIQSVMWEKFIFISPTATATSCFDNSIGELMADEEKTDIVKRLVHEVKLVADTNNILTSSDVEEKTLARLQSLPFEATSSMHADIRAGKPRCEIASLTKWVIDQAAQHELATPTYNALYISLQERVNMDEWP